MIIRKAIRILERASDRAGISLMRERMRARNRKNAVFIWIPKTAGTSLHDALNAPKLKNLALVRDRFPGSGIVTFSHMDYAELVKEDFIPREFDETSYKFAIVRNPYDRAVSLFFYLKKNRTLPAGETFLSFCRRLSEEGCEPIGLYNVKGLSQCNPQVRWLENIKLDFMGRFESLEEDCNVVFRHLDLKSLPLPRLRASKRVGYGQYYCPETKAIVEEFYKEDFDVLGYETIPGNSFPQAP